MGKICLNVKYVKYVLKKRYGLTDMYLELLFIVLHFAIFLFKFSVIQFLVLLHRYSQTGIVSK